MEAYVNLHALGEELLQPAYFHNRWEKHGALPSEVPGQLLLYPDTCTECKTISSKENASGFDFDGGRCIAFEGNSEIPMKFATNELPVPDQN